MSKEITYQNAIEELEQIVQEIENSEITVDELSTKVKRATKLISICNKKLTETEEDIQEMLKEVKKDTEEE
ncbi:MAG: exodeoxyribonuclease VII small subunit [Bacteroidales bacterium]|jgi:exodeoxyribonuclease VII small subunit